MQLGAKSHLLLVRVLGRRSGRRRHVAVGECRLQQLLMSSVRLFHVLLEVLLLERTDHDFLLQSKVTTNEGFWY